jgi:hypothetical protein
MRRVTGEVATIGFVAEDLLHSQARIDTFATFERSAYLAVDGPAGSGLVALGDQALGRGPFTVNLRGPETADFVDAVGLAHRPQNGRVEERDGRWGIVLEGIPFIVLDGAEIWEPPKAPIALAETVARGRALLGSGLVARIAALGPDDPGLAPLAVPGPLKRRTETLKAAAPLVEVVRAGLSEVLASHAAGEDFKSALTFLVGLGPGLTPSGDDLIGGLFLGLTAVGERAARDRLWALIADEVEELTNDISAMHLSVAADGAGSEAVHALLDATLRADGDGVAQTLDSVAAIGHSSGLDTAAGIAFALDAWLAAGSARQRA